MPHSLFLKCNHNSTFYILHPIFYILYSTSYISIRFF